MQLFTSRNTVYTLLASALMALNAGHSAEAFSELTGDDDVLFADEEILSDNELSEQRGGFFTAGGMFIEIGLVNQTIVNDVLIDKATFDSEALTQIGPEELQTLIQVSENGTFVSKLGLDDIPQIVNVIQNSANNVNIDNFTLLDVDVSNVSAFTMQHNTDLINQGIVGGL